MDRRRALIGYWSGLLAISLMTAFGLVLVALHFMAAAVGDVPHYISHFRLMPFSWLWVAGLGLFAAGAVALSIAMHAALPAGGWSKVTLVCVWMVGPLVALLAIFPAAAPGDITTWKGRVHEVAAIAMFCVLGFAMLSLFPALRWGWQPLAWGSLLGGLTFFAITPWMIQGFVEGSPDIAVSERVVVVLQGAWLFTLGVWSRAETAPFVRANVPRTLPTQPTPSATQATD